MNMIPARHDQTNTHRASNDLGIFVLPPLIVGFVVLSAFEVLAFSASYLATSAGRCGHQPSGAAGS